MVSRQPCHSRSRALPVEASHSSCRRRCSCCDDRNSRPPICSTTECCRSGHEVLLLRVLTDRVSEYCGKVEQHDYRLCLAVNGIDHTRTKAQSRKPTGWLALDSPTSWFVRRPVFYRPFIFNKLDGSLSFNFPPRLAKARRASFQPYAGRASPANLGALWNLRDSTSGVCALAGVGDEEPPRRFQKRDEILIPPKNR
jgi:hypothetical protein